MPLLSQQTKKKMTNNNNNLHFLSHKCKSKETLLSREDLNKILEQSLNPDLLTEVKEAVLWNKDSFMNIIISNVSNGNLNQDKVIDKFSWYNNWRKENSKLNFKYDEI